MSKKTHKTIAACAVAVFFATALLLDAQAASEGIRNGLKVSAAVLIPSLFPFMALCGFIALTGIDKNLSRPFHFVSKRLFKLPGELGGVVLLSLIGGYPAGAKMISELLGKKSITRKTAERMLCFCVNPGPPFVITAVGAGMFLNRAAGVILLASQLFATIAVGAAVSLKADSDCAGSAPPANEAFSAGAAFVQAVAGAASSVITLCAFAVFFSGVMEMARSAGIMEALSVAGLNGAVAEAVFCGFFEVTAGCLAAARVGGAPGLALASASISFGGISVVFQVMSFFKGSFAGMKPYLASRIAHMAISAFAASILGGAFCQFAPAFANSMKPEMFVSGRTAIITMCLIGMSTILLLSPGGSANGKRRKHNK